MAGGEVYRLEIGDVFLTHSDSLLGKLIRRFERDKGEAPSRVNHVGVISRFGWYNTGYPIAPQAQSVEALWHVRCGDFSAKYAKYDGSFSIYRPNFVTTLDQILISRISKSYCGQQYGWWKLLFHAFKQEDVLRFRKFPICSSLVGDVFERSCHYLFGKPGLAVDPDDIEDWILAHPAEWTCVRPLAPPAPPPNAR